MADPNRSSNLGRLPKPPSKRAGVISRSVARYGRKPPKSWVDATMRRNATRAALRAGPRPPGASTGTGLPKPDIGRGPNPPTMGVHPSPKPMPKPSPDPVFGIGSMPPPSNGQTGFVKRQAAVIQPGHRGIPAPPKKLTDKRRG